MIVSDMKRLLVVFGSFIDTIKRHDNSIDFFIHGGAIRQALSSSSLNTDIDLFPTSMENYVKLSSCLVNMGFRVVSTTPNGQQYSLFNQINVDLIKPFDIVYEFVNPRIIINDFRRLVWMDPMIAAYWSDFTNSTCILDSDYNFYYSKDFFISFRARILKGVLRNTKLIKSIAAEHKICKEDEELKSLFFDFIKLQDYLSGVGNVWSGRLIKFKDQNWDVTDVFPSNEEIDRSTHDELYKRYGGTLVMILNNNQHKNSIVIFDKLVNIWKDVCIDNDTIRKEMYKSINRINIREES